MFVLLVYLQKKAWGMRGVGIDKALGAIVLHGWFNYLIYSQNVFAYLNTLARRCATSQAFGNFGKRRWGEVVVGYKLFELLVVFQKWKVLGLENHWSTI